MTTQIQRAPSSIQEEMIRHRQAVDEYERQVAGVDLDNDQLMPALGVFGWMTAITLVWIGIMFLYLLGWLR